MIVRIVQLPFERLEAPPEDVGFCGVEEFHEPIEARSL